MNLSPWEAHLDEKINKIARYNPHDVRVGFVAVIGGQIAQSAIKDFSMVRVFLQGVEFRRHVTVRADGTGAERTNSVKYALNPQRDSCVRGNNVIASEFDGT